MWGEVNLFFHAVDQHHQVVGLFPGVEVVQHLVEDNSETPNVALDSVGVADDDLRTHVDGGADCGLHGGVVFCFLVDDHLGKTEV